MLKEGDTVEVVVQGVDDRGKISVSYTHLAMADLAALRGADAADLARGERSEVVLVHVTLGVDGRQVVDLLLHAQHSQGGDAQDLGLATLEQGGTVHARHNVHLGGQGADVAQATDVYKRQPP